MSSLFYVTEPRGCREQKGTAHPRTQSGTWWWWTLLQAPRGSQFHRTHHHCLSCGVGFAIIDNSVALESNRMFSIKVLAPTRVHAHTNGTCSHCG